MNNYFAGTYLQRPLAFMEEQRGETLLPKTIIHKLYGNGNNRNKSNFELNISLYK